MIPKTLHFVGARPARPFAFTDYVAIRSALQVNPGCRAVYHAAAEPTGLYWQLIRPHVELRTVAVDGDTSALCTGLRILLDAGGILLRLDTVSVASLEDLLHHHVVVGTVGDSADALQLGDGAVLAEPGADLVRRWLDAARSGQALDLQALRDAQRSGPEARRVLVLDRGAFHHPGPSAAGVRALFIDDLQFPQARLHTLWRAHAGALADKLDERNAALVDSTYNRLARAVLGDDAERFAALRAQELAEKLTVPIRANLGCGANKREGWLNVDSQAASSPDLVFDLTAECWPLDTDSVGEVELSHVLEHTGAQFETVIKELYRVCRHGARIAIKVPHPRHDFYLADPTHSRPLLPLSFQLLDAEWCKQGLLSGQTATPLGVYWRVDFELRSWQLVPSADRERLAARRMLWALGYPFLTEWAERVTRGLKQLLGRQNTPTSFNDRREAYLARHLGNLVNEVRVELRVRKPEAGPADTAPGAGPLTLAVPTAPTRTGSPAGSTA